MPKKNFLRPVWKGGISFGLIYIPVKLYSAVTTVSLDLDMLDSRDSSPIKFSRVNEKTGKEVDWKDITKGYKYKNDEYVVLDEADFDKVAQSRSKTIEIVDFVDVDEIDSKYFEKPYYLEPDEPAKKTYALLRESLKQENKVGLAEFVLRNREHLVILKPEDDVLILNQLRYADEIKPSNQLNLPDEKIKIQKNELEMAKILIDKMTDKFKPDKFHDDYLDELKKIIEAKAKKRTINIKKAEEPKVTEIDDLMDMLRKSLNQVEASK